jgi:preprotein translocase subunit YajC
MFTTSAYADTAPAAGGTSDFQSTMTQMAPFLLIPLVFYFLLIRPQQQKAKEVKQQQANLRRGDRVVTAGGIVGVVARVINDDEVEIQIAEGVKVRVVRNTIATILARTEPAAAKETKDVKAEEAETAETPAPEPKPRRRGAAK